MWSNYNIYLVACLFTGLLMLAPLASGSEAETIEEIEAGRTNYTLKE